MSGVESGATDAAGVLLNTLVTDTHLESNPQIAPSTSADSKPVLVDTSSSYPEIITDSSPSRTGVPGKHAKQTKTGKNGAHVLGSGQQIFDLRHEQTYLTALKKTDMSAYAIAKVTVYDFLIVPTLTNSFWVLALDGFKFLRTGSTRSGRKFGEMIRDFLNVGGVLD